MSTARSAIEDAPAADIAAALREAPFVRVVARADGDSLAASGILASACRSADIPFHVRAGPNPVSDTRASDADDEATAAAATDVDADDDGLTVLVGLSGGDVSIAGRPASVTAFEVAREFGVEPDPVLGLAGVVVAESVVGTDGSGTMLDAATRRELVERRPGVGVPTGDLGDGIAHSTLLHAPFSGDGESVQAMLAELDLPAEVDDDAHRKLASLVAIETATADGATPRAAETVERALRPYATPAAASPFETVEGYADVLDAVARRRPGTGIALALGHGDAAKRASLTAWRNHARVTHRLLTEATTGRYEGLFAARVETDDEAALPTAARLLRDFRSPEPVALVVADGHAAATSVDPIGLGDTMAEAATRLGGTGFGTDTRGEARFDGEVKQFITAFREALA